jgi:hypothetical protein
MQIKPQSRFASLFIMSVMIFFFLGYCFLTFFKTSVNVDADEVSFFSLGAIFPCDANCVGVVNAFLYKEIFDHLRTASVSLLIGFVIGKGLLDTSQVARRKFAFAIAICAPMVMFSAMLGEVQFGVRVLLVALGALGMVDAWRAIRAQPEPR